MLIYYNRITFFHSFCIKFHILYNNSVDTTRK